MIWIVSAIALPHRLSLTGLYGSAAPLPTHKKTGKPMDSPVLDGWMASDRPGDPLPAN
ncbi:MAG TPA: hypothetical protein V6D02_00680 [Candidatus Obscuribacterales bacterium]